MNPNRDYLDSLSDIIEMMDKIVLFIAGITKEQFIEDEKTVFAVVRAIEIIGEATKNIPQSVRKGIRKCPGRKWPACETN